jgi:hypothetical protein
MHQLLLDLPLRRPSDRLRARQRARQIADLLGYRRDRQTAIATAVFEIAAQGGLRRGTVVRFEIVDDRFRVFALPHSALRMEIAVPAQTKLERADLAWTVQTLNEQAPPNVLEEIRLMNLELARMLHTAPGSEEHRRPAAAA